MFYSETMLIVKKKEYIQLHVTGTSLFNVEQWKNKNITLKIIGSRSKTIILIQVPIILLYPGTHSSVNGCLNRSVKMSNEP